MVDAMEHFLLFVLIAKLTAPFANCSFYVHRQQNHKAQQIAEHPRG
jgi:hypothetical protein